MKNLHNKINKVRAQGAIEKDGKMVAAGKYNYHSIDGVTDHLRQLFVLHGLTFSYTTVSHELTVQESGTMVTVKELEITIADVDDATQFVTSREIGYGIDRQDKGPGKATSYALKTFFTAFFMLKGQPDENDEIIPLSEPRCSRAESEELQTSVTEQGIDESKFLKAAQSKTFDGIPAARVGALRAMLAQRRKGMQ